MERLIPVMNRIQDAVASVNIGMNLNLPQIAVVGGQSVGKSSILEGLVGRAFLPTGAGVVTRRPLLLRMRNTSQSGSDDEWGEFGHKPGEKMHDFGAIRDEITADTERVCGSRTVISNQPIVLTIHSPRVLDLTLIDLPGITRVPVGDQPLDIEDQIRAMIMEFVENPNCIILAIVSGSADLATADGLALARRADPEGRRTIGVVTKLDLVDKGVDLMGVLENRVYPLNLGYIGVVCRSFRDVESKKELAEQKESEEKFFRGHPSYRRIADKCGISYLGKYLNNILLDHIYSRFPEIKKDVTQAVQESENELAAYGENISFAKSEQGIVLLNLFTKFSGRFGEVIEGKVSGKDSAPGQLVGRARIDYIFRDVFARTVTNFDSFSGLTDNDIRVAIQNATGPKAMLLIPEVAFEMLVKRQIAKLESPSIQCAELVFEELKRVVQMAEVPEFRRFINLREQIYGVVLEILRTCLEPTIKMIKDVVAMELAYINTTHPDFIGTNAARSPPPAPSGNSSSSSHDKRSSVNAGSSSRSKSATPRTSKVEEPPETGEAKGFFSNLGFMLASRNQGRRESHVPGGNHERAVSSSALDSVREEPDTLSSSSSAPAGLGTGRLGSRAAAGVSSAWEGQKDRGLGGPRLPQVPAAIMPASVAPSERERAEIGIIKNLLANYLHIVKKNVSDSVPKTVMFFMVNNLKDTIQRECVARLYKEEMFDKLLAEGKDVAVKRKKCHERLQALYRVIEVFEQVRDMNL